MFSNCCRNSATSTGLNNIQIFKFFLNTFHSGKVNLISTLISGETYLISLILISIVQEQCYLKIL